MNILLFLDQLGVCAAGLLNNRGRNLGQERVVDAEQLAMACRTAQQTAQDVTTALIGRDNAVADHHNGRTDMVGDNTQRNIGLFTVAVVLARDFGYLVGDVAHSVDIEQRADALHHAGQALKAHTSINILLLEFGVIAVAVVVKLGKYVVPDLHIAVTVAADRAARLAAAVLWAAVVVDLRTRTARTRTVLPEVVLLTKAEDALSRDTDVFVPNFKCFVVIHIDGRVQPVRINADPFRTGQELPAPGNRFLFEVIAKGEVAQHFKERAVARGFAHVFDITRADALLAGRHAMARRLLLAGKIRLHRRHARIDQQKRRVVLRDERKARQAEMSLGLEKFQVHLAQLI